jgi:hypothetical protein
MTSSSTSAGTLEAKLVGFAAETLSRDLLVGRRMQNTDTPLVA